MSMISFLDKIGLSWTLILTKIDKLDKESLVKNEKDKLKILHKNPAAYPLLFSTSSNKKIGLEQLRAYISTFSTK